jgi:hypothetical protein
MGLLDERLGLLYVCRCIGHALPVRYRSIALDISISLERRGIVTQLAPPGYQGVIVSFALCGE